MRVHAAGRRLGRSAAGRDAAKLTTLADETGARPLVFDLASENAIRAAGRDPVQRDSYYNHLPRKQQAVPAPSREPDLVCA